MSAFCTHKYGLKMKILSWNINGVRACKVDLKKMFDSLDADVICLQETKVTRDMLDEATAIVDGYSSYFSFSRKRSGYSGVANYCKNAVTPEHAEEGLSGQHSTNQSRVVGHYGNLSTFTNDELVALDAEGRACITQHRVRFPDGGEKDIAIINVYCPRFDPGREDRHQYKLRFFALLQTRAEAILETGSHVIILGDINTTHKTLDRCETDEGESSKVPSRIWLNQLLWEQDHATDLTETDPDSDASPAITPYTRGGQFVDTYRYFYPDKEGAFTNWCTLTNARATNYGRRLDYILADTELAKTCLVDAWIMPDVEGSDHCPVKIELRCTPLPAKSCPPSCTKFMPEFTGKQQKLSMFFTKKTQDDKKEDSSGDKMLGSQEQESGVDMAVLSPPKSNNNKRSVEMTKCTSQPLKKQKSDLKNSGNSGKQGTLANFFSKNSANSKTVSGKQATLASFFSKNSANTKTVSDRETSGSNTPSPDTQTSVSHADNSNTEASKCHDSPCKSQTVSEKESTSKVALVKENSQQTASAWKNLLGGLGPAPLCKGHKEPCVLRMVKKPGPNKGKQFYTCARGEGLKTNPEARCEYFVWVTKKKS